MIRAANLVEDLADFKDADALLADANDVFIIAEAVGAYVVVLTVVLYRNRIRQQRLHQIWWYNWQILCTPWQRSEGYKLGGGSSSVDFYGAYVVEFGNDILVCGCAVRV